MDAATIEPLPNTPDSTQDIAKPVKRPFITSANAKRLQLLARDAKARKAAERAAAAAKVAADTELLRPLLAQAVALTTGLAAEPEQEYRLKRLQRTREQLAKLDKLLDDAEDWKAAKAICEAIARLSVIEGNLAGRPLPGSHRPSKEKTKSAGIGSVPGPLDIAPE